VSDETAARWHTEEVEESPGRDTDSPADSVRGPTGRRHAIPSRTTA
jgi:hypothetical protein